MKTIIETVIAMHRLVVGSGLTAVFAVGVGGCTSLSPSLDGGSGTEDGASTTAALGSGSSSDSGSSSSALDESTTAEEPALPSCLDPRPIPPSRFDCSGADGVLPISAILEAGDDPSILEGVRRVEGSIHISRTELTNLDFMGCVEEVTGEVVIFGNDALTSVDGLWNLRAIGTDFVFSDNDALTDFDGLPNVTTLTGTIRIEDNDALETITGFHTLASVLGVVDEYWDVLVGGDLWIHDNPALRSMDGLGGLMVLEGVFAVTHNPSLCMSSVDCVGSGIVEPDMPPSDWTTRANDDSC